MAYEPTTWTAGDTVTAAKMNKLEQGVANSGNGSILWIEATLIEEDGGGENEPVL